MADERSLLEHAVVRGGVVRGSQAASVVVQWAIAQRELGHDLGEGQGISAAVREFAAYWRKSERTAWRDVRRFRAVFPEHETPASLAATFLGLMRQRHLDDAQAAMASLRFAA